VRGINFLTNRNAASGGELTPRPDEIGIKIFIVTCKSNTSNICNRI